MVVPLTISIDYWNILYANKANEALFNQHICESGENSAYNNVESTKTIDMVD